MMQKHIPIIFVIIAAIGQGLYAQLPTGKPQGDTIVWPAAYEPGTSRFYVHNEIDIKASAELVWGYLRDALKWESWYKGCKKVRLTDTAQKRLQAGTIMKWQTMGLKFVSYIREFEPNRLLAWESKKKSIRGYHVWLILPTATGCRVITEESQNGWLTFFEKLFQRNKLKKLHDDWLWGLKIQAETSQWKNQPVK